MRKASTEKRGHKQRRAAENPDKDIMKTYVTSYPNPDTDGTACAIVYAGYLNAQGESAEAVVAGDLDPETAFVLDTLQLQRPRLVENCLQAERICLFDTHHTSQVGAYLDAKRVVLIIDHHPAGNPQDFPNAEITNAEVGAAATLLAERLQLKNYTIPKNHAALLYAAVISNTLGFSAPTTNERDRAAANYLSQNADLPKDFQVKMFEARSGFATRTTRELVERDCKIFELAGKRVAICQLEGIGMDTVTARSDLKQELLHITCATNADLVLLSAVDIVKQTTVLVPANAVSERALAEALHIVFLDGKGTVGRILLRKSDLVPALTTFLAAQT